MTHQILTNFQLKLTKCFSQINSHKLKYFYIIHINVGQTKSIKMTNVNKRYITHNSAYMFDMLISPQIFQEHYTTPTNACIIKIENITRHTKDIKLNFYSTSNKHYKHLPPAHNNLHSNLMSLKFDIPNVCWRVAWLF